MGYWGKGVYWRWYWGGIWDGWIWELGWFWGDLKKVENLDVERRLITTCKNVQAAVRSENKKWLVLWT
jgi:hypothetical protein